MATIITVVVRGHDTKSNTLVCNVLGGKDFCQYRPALGVSYTGMFDSARKHAVKRWRQDKSLSQDCVFKHAHVLDDTQTHGGRIYEVEIRSEYAPK
jgi:hypothetical protein